MPLTTIRVLLVEDEIMIRMMVADMVEQLGHTVAAEAGDVGRATELAQTGLFDLAILDVNLNGRMSFPAADILVERRIPLLFASGYAADSFPAAFRSTPRLHRVASVALLHQLGNPLIEGGKLTKESVKLMLDW